MKKILLFILCIILLVGTFGFFLLNKPSVEEIGIPLKTTETEGKFALQEIILKDPEYENLDLDAIFEDKNFNERIVDFNLKSHPSVDYVKQVGLGNQVVMWYDVNSNYGLLNALGEPEFTNMKTGELINRDWKYVYWGNESYEELVYSCDYQDCFQTGTQTKTREAWLPYNSRDILKGQIRIGVEVDVQMEETTDVIWNVGGKRISKHAIFTSGATTSYVIHEGRNYTVFTYLNNGTFNTTSNLTVEVLMVAGGGAGGNGQFHGAGGGAGGLIYNTSYFIFAGDYNVIVGSGGLGNVTPYGVGGNGTNSTFGTLNAKGGGGGAAGLATPGSSDGRDGGSGGGSAGGVVGIRGAGYPGQGHDGGIGVTPANYGAGGGGGAGASGGNGTTTTGGDGGVGLQNNITGTNKYYAGGGGGSIYLAGTPGTGGLGGGGNGSLGAGTNGTVNTGGGGGGSERAGSPPNKGGDGGSGIVIIRYAIGIEITLFSPENNTNFTINTINFSANVSYMGTGGIQNVTINVYYDNGTSVWNETNSSGFEGFYNFSNTFSDGDYNWNVTAYDSSFGIYLSSTTRSFSIYTVFENSQEFNNETLEGNINIFTANVTIRESISITIANLIYNGTSNTGSFSQSGNDSILTINFLAPNVDTDTNLTFFWSLTLSDNQIINLTSHNQTVIAISLDNCSVNTVVLYNYTIVDEGNQSLLSDPANTTAELNINLLDIIRQNYIANFSKKYLKINPFAVCINKNLSSSTYIIDSVVKYEATGYSIEYHNIVNATITNSTIPEEITLYDLFSTDATEFKITFKAEDFTFVENALIYIDRQYIAENNTFKTVELPKTDSNGQTVGHFVRNDVIYNIRVIKEGVVLGNFKNIIAFCEDYTIGACQMVLEAVPEDFLIFSYDEQLGIIFQSLPIYNEDTSAVSFDFSTDDGTVKTVLMEVTRDDIFGNRSICNNTITSSSGTLICSIDPNIDDSILRVSVFVDDQPVVLSNVKLESSDYGNLGYVLWFFLTFFFLLLFAHSKTEILIGLSISFIGAIALGITRGNIIGLGSAGIWVLVIIILGIYKLNKDKPQ